MSESEPLPKDGRDIVSKAQPQRVIRALVSARLLDDAKRLGLSTDELLSVRSLINRDERRDLQTASPQETLHGYERRRHREARTRREAHRGRILLTD